MKKAVPRRIIAQVGLRVIELRHERDLTQEGLAELLGVSARQVQRLEAGCSSPSLAMLVRMANALDVEPIALLTPASRAVQRRPGRPISRAKPRTA